MSKNPNQQSTWRRKEWACGLCVVLVVCGIRLPSIWYQKGGQDEQWYSVPGWTVAREGVPRIPYCIGTEQTESVFTGADQRLYALPPAYFYFQAPFFWMFPPGYGTARLAAWLASLLTLCILFQLMREVNVRASVALLATFACGFGRAFYLSAQDSRPDSLCMMFGVAAILFLLRSQNHAQVRQLIFSGISLGLAGLSHPYAIVIAMQLGVCLLVLHKPFKQKLSNALIIAAATSLTMLLWLPLIALDAETFWLQFSRNVLSRSGPGLVSRLAWPWPMVPAQLSVIWERLGIFQLVLVAVIMSWGTILLLAHMKSVSTDDQPNLQRRFAIRVSWLLAASGAYFHIASLGMHPAKGYLCYPWVMLWLLAAVCLNGIRSWQLRTALFVGVLFIQLPGSGMRAAWTYLMRHEGVAYNRSRFCEDLNEKLPPNARLLVSPEFVFEFEILGRQPINASLVPIYNDVLGYKFDYLIAGRQVLDEQIPEELNCKFQWDMGNPDDPLACYARVYAITPKTPQKINWPRTN